MYYNAKNEKIVYMESLPAIKHARLNIFLAGTTKPNPNYYIDHNQSSVHELDRYQFEFVTRGKGYVSINNTLYTIQAGDLFFINKWSPNYYYTDASSLLEKEFITLNGILADKLIEVYHLNAPFHCVSADALPLFHQAHSLLDKINILGRDQAFRQIEIILHRLVQLLSTTQTDVSTGHISLPEAMLDYIHCRIESRFTLNDMCQHFFLSKSQLIRAFKARYRITPMQYALLKKIDTSMYLLKNSNLSIESIANRLSFSDSKHFSKTFSRIIGISPIKYRKHIVENKGSIINVDVKKQNL